MIINCICGKKKFRLSDELMPEEGSKVRCGSCSEVWFFHPNKGNIDQQEFNDKGIDNAEIDGFKESRPANIAETPPDQENTDEEINSNLSEIKEDNTSFIQEDEKVSNFKIFTDSDDDLPSKEEMDKNLDLYKKDRENNLNFFQKLFKKDRIRSAAEALEKQNLDQSSDEENEINQARRTRLLTYLLFLLLIVLSVMLVPLRDSVIQFLPFMASVLDFLTPVYENVKDTLKFN